MGDLQPTQDGSSKIKRKRTHEDDGPTQNKTDEEEAPTLLHGGVCLFLAKKLPAFVQAQLTSSLAHGLELNNKKIKIRERTFFKPMSRSVTSLFEEPQPPRPPRCRAAKCYKFYIPGIGFWTCHVPTKNSTGSNPPPRLDVTLRDMGLKNVPSLITFQCTDANC